MENFGRLVKRLHLSLISVKIITVLRWLQTRFEHDRARVLRLLSPLVLSLNLHGAFPVSWGVGSVVLLRLHVEVAVGCSDPAWSFISVIDVVFHLLLFLLLWVFWLVHQAVFLVGVHWWNCHVSFVLLTGGQRIVVQMSLLPLFTFVFDHALWVYGGWQIGNSDGSTRALAGIDVDDSVHVLLELWVFLGQISVCFALSDRSWISIIEYDIIGVAIVVLYHSPLVFEYWLSTDAEVRPCHLVSAPSTRGMKLLLNLEWHHYVARGFLRAAGVVRSNLWLHILALIISNNDIQKGVSFFILTAKIIFTILILLL